MRIFDVQTCRLRGLGGLDAIVREEGELPAPWAHEIIVRIRATSLNRVTR